MLKYRLITALILIPIVIAALFLLPPLAFALVTLVVCMLAAWEWGQLAGFTSRSQRIWLAILCGFLLALMMLSVPAYHQSVPQVSGSLWLSLVWWLLYVMLLVWGADSGAYLFGKLFGKHKLAPKVSPGKTWEGLIGGLLTSAVISWLFGRYAPLNVVPTTLLVCSVLAALASVLGDLTESMFKREAGIKDSGHLIPGHGGILDRIDSLTAAVPVFACLMLLVF